MRRFRFVAATLVALQCSALQLRDIGVMHPDFGESLGSKIKSNLEDVVKDAKLESVRSDLSDDVTEQLAKDAVADKVQDAVEDKIKDVVEDKIKDVVVEDKIKDDVVEDKIKDVVEDKIKDVVEDKIEKEVEEAAKGAIESLPVVGSLPPIAVPSKEGVASIVPVDLLPSNVNVVTHEANYGELNPRHRPKCSAIVNQVEKATFRNRNSPMFGAFETIIQILGDEKSDGPANTDEDDDKTINYGIDVIKSSAAGPYALNWNYIASLRTCAVDDLGRTIFMKLVEKGHLRSLGNDGSQRLSGVDIVKLRDVMNNNVLHLAVMSKNIHVCELLFNRVGADHAVPFMQQPNIHGERPLDIAIRLHLEDVTSMLKARYMTFNALSKMMMRTKHQSPAVLRAAGRIPAPAPVIEAAAAA